MLHKCSLFILQRPKGGVGQPCLLSGLSWKLKALFWQTLPFLNSFQNHLEVVWQKSSGDAWQHAANTQRILCFLPFPSSRMSVTDKEGVTWPPFQQDSWWWEKLRGLWGVIWRAHRDLSYLLHAAVFQWALGSFQFLPVHIHAKADQSPWNIKVSERLCGLGGEGADAESMF